MELPQKISGKKIAFAAQQVYAKIRFPCVVVRGGVLEDLLGLEDVLEDRF